MADATLFSMRGTRPTAYPLRYVSNEQHRRQKRASARREYHLWSISSSLFVYVPLKVRHTYRSLELTQIYKFHCHRIYETVHHLKIFYII